MGEKYTHYAGMSGLLFVVNNGLFMLLKGGCLAACIQKSPHSDGEFLVSVQPELDRTQLLKELIVYLKKATDLRVDEGHCRFVQEKTPRYLGDNNPCGHDDNRFTLMSLYGMDIVDVLDDEMLFEVSGVQVPVSRDELGCMEFY